MKQTILVGMNSHNFFYIKALIKLEYYCSFIQLEITLDCEIGANRHLVSFISQQFVAAESILRVNKCIVRKKQKFLIHLPAD